jgi:UDP-glucose:(heptosyl)LPS alpha-1,3-glucosyltransferase
VIAVHIVFAEYKQRVKQDMSLWNNPLHSWPRLTHQAAYRDMLIWLEQRIYKKTMTLIAISQKTAHNLCSFYQHIDHIPVIYHGFNQTQFNPTIRAQLRDQARQELRIAEHSLSLLLIGNAWKKKGLLCLLQAVTQLQGLNIMLLVVGRDQTSPYQQFIDQHSLHKHVVFLPPRLDVEFYYAAADVYTGPSLEDAFALPPVEAMSCGIPAIVSSQAGASELVTDGVDAFILKDPKNADELASYIEQLYKDPALRQLMGEQAAITAHQYTWERNAAKLHMLLQQTILRKRKGVVRG